MTRMLRTSLLLLFVLLPLAASGQTTRTVLIERFTGTWCQWCPYGADVVNSLYLQYPNVREVAYHIGDVMEISDGVAIKNHLMVSGYPTAAIDRILWYDGSQYTFTLSRSVWPNAVAVRDTTPSPVSISVSGSYHEPTRLLTANITLNVVSNMTGEFYVNCFLTESGINEPQKKYDTQLQQNVILDPYYHNRVLRKMIGGPFPSAATTSGWTTGATFNDQRTFTIPSGWDHTKMQIVVFVTKKTMITVGGTPQPFNMAIQQSYAEPLSTALNFTPVNLVSFNAKQVDEHVQLNWMTAMENSNRGWFVERRADNGDWSDIGFVDGYGTTNQNQSYGYADADLVPNTVYDYRLRQVDFDGTTELSAVARVIYAPRPTATTLHPNYPNPFNPSTTLTVQMEEESTMRLEVFDALGRLVKTLADGNYVTGSHAFTWNGTDNGNQPVMSGIYFCRMTTPTTTQTQQMQLSK